MAVFIDSAIIPEVREAVESGLVSGVTTNPSLLAMADRPAEDIIRELCQLTDGPVFYQVTEEETSLREMEARRFADISPRQVVIKLPCTYRDLRLAAKLSTNVPCAITAVFSPAQTILAAETGARYVAPYVNRATRQLGDGISLVQTMADLIATGSRPIEIVAASLKTSEEVINVMLAGARHVTIPLSLIRTMAEHECTEAAIEEFSRSHRRGTLTS